MEEPDGRAAGTQRRTVINPGLARLFEFSLVLPLRFRRYDCIAAVEWNELGAALCLFGACAVHGIRMALARATSMSSRRANLHPPSRQDAIPEFISILAA